MPRGGTGSWLLVFPSLPTHTSHDSPGAGSVASYDGPLGCPYGHELDSRLKREAHHGQDRPCDVLDVDLRLDGNRGQRSVDRLPVRLDGLEPRPDGIIYQGAGLTAPEKRLA
jgi:hypothetical protein